MSKLPTTLVEIFVAVDADGYSAVSDEGPDEAVTRLHENENADAPCQVYRLSVNLPLPATVKVNLKVEINEPSSIDASAQVNTVPHE